MKTDSIIEIGIDEKERLYIKPETERFTMIYRSATEVHWDDKGNFLYSPKPRGWTYLDWYKHIVDVIGSEENCKLVLTKHTVWKNITDDLKKQIKEQ